MDQYAGSDVVTDDVCVSRGRWCLRRNENVDDLALSDCLKQVRQLIAYFVGEKVTI